MSPYGISLSHSLLGAAALLIAVALTRSAWNRRSRPGARALATVGGLLTLGSIAFIVMFVYPARYQGLWIVTLYNTSGFVAVFAFLFAIRFTGRGQWLTWSVRTLLISLPVILLIVSFLPFELGVETTSQAGILTQRVIGLVSGVLTPLYAIAAAILLWAAISRDAVPYGQGLLPAGSLLVLALAPILSSVFAHSERIFPVVLLLAGGGLLATLHWHRPLEQLPVARPVVQSRIVDELSEPVVAIDRKDRVVDLNTAAEDTFGCEQAAVVGRPVQRIFDDAVLAHEERQLIRVSDGVLTVVPEAVDDTDGVPLGTVLLFGDATDQRLRERQTRMLTDLLSEVIGVQLDEIARLASSVEERDSCNTPGVAPSDARADPEGVGERIRTRSDLLLTVGKRAREMEQALAGTSLEESSDLLTGIRTAAARSSIQADEHTIQATGESYTVAVPHPLLIAGFAAVFDTVTIRNRSVTISFEADTGGRGANDGSVAGSESGTGSDAGASNRQPGPQLAVMAADGHGYDGVVHVDIRTDSRDDDADPVAEPTAEHPAAKLLSLIAIDAGGSVGVDGTPWEHLRLALPARKTRSGGER
ncbi:histidine kinase N-terminal 7TM domain-containing protein [Haloplanus pelagicus]|uniref:histidine kinase N-terminal 7TM domain-containing protein n=1 Tax=Haloplanus pelagicus TaxID=2949995 RepID=UPI00204097CB|nr:histidine kinase N-terminal 7TM domain-containing protein [Haloplanus sp. HW8-1]